MGFARTGFGIVLLFAVFVILSPACNKPDQAKTTAPSGATGDSTSGGATDSAAKPQPRSVTPPAGEVGSTADPGDSNVLRTAGVEFVVPTGWIKQQPGSAMRLAQYSLPGASPAEVVVYYFGQGQGGSREANIQRWVGQFQNPEDPSKEPKFELRDAKQAGLDVTVVQVWGTYQPSPMTAGGGPTDPQPNYSLYGIILEGGSTGAVFVKASGPESTMASHATELDQFAASARVAQ